MQREAEILLNYDSSELLALFDDVSNKGSPANSSRLGLRQTVGDAGIALMVA